MCYPVVMARDITQRQLRNESGEIMRGLDRGETFVVTRHGVPVGELTPLRRRRFVSADAALAMFRVSTWRVFAATSTASHPRIPALVPDAPRAQRGVIDTSVVIDLERLEAA